MIHHPCVAVPFAMEAATGSCDALRQVSESNNRLVSTITATKTISRSLRYVTQDSEHSEACTG